MQGSATRARDGGIVCWDRLGEYPSRSPNSWKSQAQRTNIDRPRATEGQSWTRERFPIACLQGEVAAHEGSST
jgi:hypothetical protein